MLFFEGLKSGDLIKNLITGKEQTVISCELVPGHLEQTFKVARTDTGEVFNQYNFHNYKKIKGE